MDNSKVRSVIVYRHYFSDFFDSQTQKVQAKILWVFRLIETQEQIPVEYFKHMEGTEGLYEIRVKHSSNIFRIFCFFDDGKLIVLANGFQKKTDKTPKQEIERALAIKAAYEAEKTISPTNKK